MSCFGGQMKVYKEISIDRFDGYNLNASAFFLSHCHSDHMVGLESEILKNKLQTQRSVYLYTSEVTKVLLMEDDRYQFLEPFVHTLPIEEPKLISISNSNKKEVLVTLLSAGHCPGSVMFLFEGDEGTALYTGDFRLPKGSAARLKLLHSGNLLKKIDHVHFDSTFCILGANFIPTREQCLEALISIVDDWIRRGPDHIIRLNLSAKYGYEYLFEELHKKFKKRIYSPRAYMYRCLPPIFKVLTDNPALSQIYASFKNERLKISDRTRWKYEPNDVRVEQKQNYKYRNITLSTMYFTHAATPAEIQVKINENHFRLCFSFHSSLSEVCDFLSYLKPKSIHANVIPRQGETFETVEERMRKLCFERNRQHQNVAYKPVGILKSNSTSFQVNCASVRDEKRRKKLLLDDSSDDEFKSVVKKRKR